MIPSIGRIVTYRLSEQDAVEITQRRGLQVHAVELLRGNKVKEGDAFPMMIVRVWDDQPDSCVNGQVFMDGNDTHWATSVQAGEGPRTFSWYQPAPAQ